MEQKNILVTFPVTDKQKHSLEMYAPGSHFLYRPREEVTTEDVHNANIIIGNVNPSQLVGASKLEWLQLDSAGTNGYLDPGVLPDVYKRQQLVRTFREILKRSGHRHGHNITAEGTAVLLNFRK